MVGRARLERKDKMHLLELLITILRISMKLVFVMVAFFAVFIAVLIR